ncbi:MAG: glycosyltransferase [Nocardioidaceae bacterium]|nr:glycosyltransferase [Nocardioidaceae bacterium]
MSRTTYLLPLRRPTPTPDRELASYLTWLAAHVEVVVADGSPPEVFADNHRQWGHRVVHFPVSSRCLNGKVAGVLDGLQAATGDVVVIADDDVRYDAATLRQVVDLMADVDLVRPQNYFDPLPWHARWDTARTLLNRALGADYPGTLAVRRHALERSNGYCGAVLFENLELIRTMHVHGRRQRVASDVYVRRLPPPIAHFRGQRVRQAYDSLAQPGRLLIELALLPAMAVAAARRTAGRSALMLAGASVVLAEYGRRRHGGRHVFAATAAWWAPVWTAERAVCIWIAVLQRLRGGVPYRGARLVRSAHSVSRLARGGCPEPMCSCEVGSRRRDVVRSRA